VPSSAGNGRGATTTATSITVEAKQVCKFRAFGTIKFALLLQQLDAALACGTV